MTDAGTRVEKPSKKVGSTRGVIKGWSSASRRRMRDYMLKHAPPSDYKLYGITVTIPGPPVSLPEAKRYWEHVSHNITQARGACMVWRLEKQKRGQPHWHAILSLPPDYNIGEWVLDTISSLKLLGPITAQYEGKGRFHGLEFTGTRDCWPGAMSYAVDVKHSDNVDYAWMRYLQDHSSKAKQEQISGYGRQWGVVGRKHYRPVIPDSTASLSRPEYFRALRVMRRMMQPLIRDSRSVFGSRLGFRSLRGSSGRSVWFTEPCKRSALRRYVDSLIQQPSARVSDPPA